MNEIKTRMKPIFNFIGVVNILWNFCATLMKTIKRIRDFDLLWFEQCFFVYVDTMNSNGYRLSTKF